jgi:hypothetical protein
VRRVRWAIRNPPCRAIFTGRQIQVCTAPEVGRIIVMKLILDETFILIIFIFLVLFLFFLLSVTSSGSTERIID